MKRKGIAEIFSIIIMLTIVILAGAFVYTFFFGAANRLLVGPAMQVESAQVVQSGGKSFLVTTVHNTGDVAFTKIIITVPSTTFNATLPATPPGGTQGGTFPISGINQGETYTVVYSATSISNQTYITTYQIN